MQILATPWSLILFIALIAFVTSGVTLRAKTQRRPHLKARHQWQLWRRRARTVWFNTRNSLIFIATLGKHVRHQGRFRRWSRTWLNWNRDVTRKSVQLAHPTNEAEVRQYVQEYDVVRVVGRGHSFNDSPVTDAAPAQKAVMLSLDAYRLEGGQQLVWNEARKHTVWVAAGMRLRDLNKALREKQLALPVLGSADAQTVGGLLATDVHGTGKRHGFLSEQVLTLKIMDGQGTVHRTAPKEKLFQAAIGGIGACGIILELELECVPLFNLEKTTMLMERTWVEANLERLFQEHDHVSFYEVGGIPTHYIRMNVSAHTGRVPSVLLGPRKLSMELADMFFSGFLLEMASTCMARSRFLLNLGFSISRWLLDGRRLVHPSSTGFSRTLYFHHDELEYSVPWEHYRDCMKELRALLLREHVVSIIESRFTPPNPSRSLLAPGAGDRSNCFIELAPSLSYAPARLQRLFRQATRIFLKHGGRAHLGKKVPLLTPTRMHAMYGNDFLQFLQVRDQQDPHRKFINNFTRRVLGP